jgi:hypothetical protein
MGIGGDYRRGCCAFFRKELTVSIREKLNQNPRLVVGTVGAVVVVVAAWIAYMAWPHQSDVQSTVNGTYYTEDDGQTFFVDSYDKLAAPFKGPNGKDAVRAIVCQYIGENKRFVGWMERYSPKGQQILARFYGEPANKLLAPPYEVMQESLVKRPGASQWISSAKDPMAATTIKRLEAKDGSGPNIVGP